MNSALTVMLRSVYRLGLTVWVGGSIFFSAFVLPTLFARLERSEAGQIASLLFPGYYWIGVALGAVLLACCIWLARTDGKRWIAAAALVAVMLGSTVYAAFVVHPKIAPLRGLAERRSEFDALHALSVRLNAVALAAGVALVLAGGWVVAPRRLDEAGPAMESAGSPADSELDGRADD